jgi:hypothetical protein
MRQNHYEQKEIEVLKDQLGILFVSHIRHLKYKGLILFVLLY